MSKQAQNQLKPNHQTCTLKHGPLKEHKSNKEYLLWWEAPCWVAQTDQMDQTDRREEGIYAICEIPSGPRFLFMEEDQWSNQSAGKVMKYSPERLSALAARLIKNNPQPVTIPIWFFLTAQWKKATRDPKQPVGPARSGNGPRTESISTAQGLAGLLSEPSFIQHSCITASVQEPKSDPQQAAAYMQKQLYWRGATTTRVLRGQSYSSSNLFLNSRSCC